jgi:hypothetical protein
MALDSFKLKQLDATQDIKKNYSKIKTYPMWSDISTDGNTANENTMTTFYTSSALNVSTNFDSNYYLNVYNSDVNTNSDAVPQFSLAIGYASGSTKLELSGSDQILRQTYPTYAIYGQLRNLLLTSESSSFSYVSSSVTVNMDSMYIISINKNLVKSGMEKGTWQLTLSGSTGIVNLMDNSAQQTSVPGFIENYDVIVSGSNEVIGKFYPTYGLILTNATRMNAILGPTMNFTSPFDSRAALTTFFNLINTGKFFKARSIDKVSSTFYYINVKHNEFNFTNNPTATDANGYTSDFLELDPRTYITGIGLHDSNGELLAVARLSKPILKTPETEVSVQVRIDF